MTYVCAAYNAAPPGEPWDAALEGQFYRELAALPAIGALEVPLHATGEIHARDSAWQLERLQSPASGRRWDVVLTLIPATLQSLQKEPRFGLASLDAAGRRAAVALAEQARQAVARINARAGRRAVRWVELHSAPRRGVAGVDSSASALADSLRELLAWDWHGARLAIEHCDRHVPGQRPEKGFLALEEELDAIVQTDGAGRLGVVINWGRSAIEGRDARAPLAHIRAAKSAGLLAGLTFSGATPRDPHYGEWLDQHAPFAQHCPNSLLTAEGAAECLKAAGAAELDFIGVKIQPLPPALTVARRIALLGETFAMLDGCLAGLGVLR